MQPVGSNIKTFRLAQGLTQEDLASKLGYTKSFLSYVESGDRELSEDDLARVATFFRVSPNELKTEKAVVSVHFRSASGGLTSDAQAKLGDAFAEYAKKHLKDRGTL